MKEKRRERPEEDGLEERLRQLEEELSKWHQHIAERTEYSYCPYCGAKIRPPYSRVEN